MERQPDDQLIIRFRQTGDRKVMSILFNRYVHLVYGVCYKYMKDKETARDMTMEVFEQLFDKIPKFEIRHFPSWLLALTKNHCLMALRKDKAETVREEKYESDLKPVMESMRLTHPSDNGFEDHKPEEVHLALHKLNSAQQQCIELFYFKKLSYAEVSEKTGFTVKQVKSYIQNGKRNLKNLLSGHEREQ